MSEANCPYCEKDFEVDDIENAEEEHQCPSCEKQIMVWTDWEPIHGTAKIDCKNGGNHDYSWGSCYGNDEEIGRCICGKMERNWNWEK